MLGEGRTINVTGNACYIEYVENYYENGIAKRRTMMILRHVCRMN